MQTRSNPERGRTPTRNGGALQRATGGRNPGHAPRTWASLPAPSAYPGTVLILLSPAKTFDLTSPLATTRHTQPRLLDHTEELVEEMRALSVSDFSRLMDISQDLAALTAERAADFELPFTQANARQAVLAFDGEAYRGLDAPGRFDTRDFTEAQKTLRLLSGLYGVLRPLDLIQPYRLEMGTRLRTDRGRDLYEFWGTTIADLLARDLADSPGADAVVNLASKEYASAVDEAALGAPMIAPRFEDTDARGRRSVVTVYAKHARGAMAAWLVRNRVRRVSELKEFDGDGYRYDAGASTPSAPLFWRRYQDRP